jgi:hypothetical protein
LPPPASSSSYYYYDYYDCDAGADTRKRTIARTAVILSRAAVYHRQNRRGYTMYCEKRTRTMGRFDAPQ